LYTRFLGNNYFLRAERYNEMKSGIQNRAEIKNYFVNKQIRLN